MSAFQVPVNRTYRRPPDPKVDANHDFISSEKCSCGPARAIACANQIYYTVLTGREHMEEVLREEARAFIVGKQLGWNIILPENPASECEAYRQAFRHFLSLAVATTRLSLPPEIPDTGIRDFLRENIGFNPGSQDDFIGLGVDTEDSAIAQTIAMSSVFPHKKIDEPHARFLPFDSLIVTYQEHLIAARVQGEHLPIRKRSGSRSGPYQSFLWPDTGQPFAEWASGIAL